MIWSETKIHAKITSLFSLFRQQFTQHHGSKLDQSQLRNVVSGLFVKLFFQTSRCFLLFRSLIHKEITLLVCLDPVDCIGVNIFEVSWCLAYILVLLCSAFQNGCSSLVFYVIQFQIGYIRISLHWLGYFSQHFEDHFIALQYCMVAPLRPPTLATVFELFGIQNMLWVVVDDAMCNNSVCTTWGSIVTVNQHYES